MLMETICVRSKDEWSGDDSAIASCGRIHAFFDEHSRWLVSTRNIYLLEKYFSLDGRVNLSLAGQEGHEEVELKYQLLNPSPQFRDIVDIARSVILAGGTMSPVCANANPLTII